MVRAPPRHLSAKQAASGGSPLVPLDTIIAGRSLGHEARTVKPHQAPLREAATGNPYQATQREQGQHLHADLPRGGIHVAPGPSHYFLQYSVAFLRSQSLPASPPAHQRSHFLKTLHQKTASLRIVDVRSSEGILLAAEGLLSHSRGASSHKAMCFFTQRECLSLATYLLYCPPAIQRELSAISGPASTRQSYEQARYTIL